MRGLLSVSKSHNAPAVGLSICHGPRKHAEVQPILGEGEHAETASDSLHYRGKNISPYLSIAMPIGGELFKNVVRVSVGASYF